MTFRKILTALDRSPQASIVFEQALALAQLDNSSLMVFTTLAWQPREATSAFVGIGTLADIDLYHHSHQIHQERLQKEIEDISTWLQFYCQRAETQGVSAEHDYKIGDPGGWICEVAKSWQADLITLGRRGRKGISEILLGSVSNHVLHHAPCSVLVVQGMDLPTTEQSTSTTQGNQEGQDLQELS
ncbi:MAG: universal stress protein [Cyanothece sp. SIO1E1]|nr:universal stress protein [Cyanothece sp. SIO1E1]